MSIEIPIRNTYLALLTQLKANKSRVIHQQENAHYTLYINILHNKIVALLHLPNGFILSVVLGPAPQTDSKNIHVERRKGVTYMRYRSDFGAFNTRLTFEADDELLFHYRVGFVPDRATYYGDEGAGVLIAKKDLTIPPPGNVYFDQQQMRSAACFLDFGKSTTGNLFYFHDLTALNTYAEDSAISLADCVKAQWPEIRFSPPSDTGNALQKGKFYKVADCYISYKGLKPKNPYEVATTMLSHQNKIYRKLRKPKVSAPTFYPHLLKRAAADLAHYQGCWQQVEANAFLNAYVNDYDTPPESMVQLAVLRPVLTHHRKHPSNLTGQIVDELMGGLPRFFDEKIGAFGRWLPKSGEQLEAEEEQKKQRIMDSWYLHHPLVNLSFILLSGGGTKQLRHLFLESVEFCIHVAKHFHYDWPIFYDLDTLDVIKAEAKPGDGGERDVAGLYAFLMLRTYDLTGSNKYLAEAKKSGKTLSLYGIDILYQANNTAYAAEALLELWTITKETRYLHLSEICIASLLRNTALWQQRYGNARAYPTFFMLFPLKDAPYAALFEEQECLASFNRYLRMAHTSKAPIAAEIYALLPEYCKYALHRLPYYYPQMLPKEILAGESKTGYIDKTLLVPVEDLGDGRQAVGTVGQEVYGAGAVFQAANYHLHPLGDTETFCFVPYPILNIKYDERSLTFEMSGVADLSCPLFFIGSQSNHLKVYANDKPVLLSTNSYSAEVNGGSTIYIRW